MDILKSRLVCHSQTVQHLPAKGSKCVEFLQFNLLHQMALCNYGELIAA